MSKPLSYISFIIIFISGVFVGRITKAVPRVVIKKEIETEYIEVLPLKKQKASILPRGGVQLKVKPRRDEQVRPEMEEPPPSLLVEGGKDVETIKLVKALAQTRADGVDNLAAQIGKLSPYNNGPELTKRLNGNFSGELVIFAGEFINEVHELRLNFNFSGDGETLEGDSVAEIFRDGRMRSSGRSTGNSQIEKLESHPGFYFIHITPKEILQIKAPSNSNAITVNYYYNLVHSGSGKLFRSE